MLVSGFFYMIYSVGGERKVGGERREGVREEEKGRGEERKGCHFFEKGIVDLFCGADFYSAHHFASGNDDAAEGLGERGHGWGIGFFDRLMGWVRAPRRVSKGVGWSV